MKDEMMVEPYGMGHDMPIFKSQAWCVVFVNTFCGHVDSHDMRSQLNNNSPVLCLGVLEEKRGRVPVSPTLNISKPRKFAA